MMDRAAEFLIRRMSTADLPRVLEIEQNLRDAPHWAEPVWRAVLDAGASGRRIVLVAADRRNGIVQGFVVAAMVPPQAEVESVAVAAELQRMGLASRLFAALVGELRVAGIREVFLEVRASNRAALEFYRTLGFSQSGLRTRYYADPSEDAVLMSMKLP
jgi:[ribosomal protein S18]-alanine N-acetyltransferase